MMPKAVLLAAACALAVAAYASDNGATGKMTVAGKSTELHWAIAKTAENPFHKGQTDVVVLLTNIQVTPEQWDSIRAMMDLADTGKLTGIEAEIDKDKQVISGQIYSPLFKLQGNSFSAVGMHKFEPKTFSSSEVSGKLSTSHDSSFHDVSYSYSVTFHAVTTAPKAAAAPVLKGKALPAGGGDPGKVYLAFTKSIAAGDLAAVRKGVDASRAKEMDSPDFKKMFPVIQAMQAKKITITGGSVDGDNATLLATGMMDNDKATGTITMVREGGVWKVKQESWESKSH